MSHLKESEGKVSKIFKYLLKNYLPNSKDNIKQIFLKLLFLLSVAGVIVSSVVIGGYLTETQKQKNIIEESRQIWYSKEISSTVDTNDENYAVKQELLKENKDFIGWIRINNTKIDNPVYKTDNNDYYLTHNQCGEESRYGAIFAHSENIIRKDKTDKNIVLFGHNMKDGMMFGDLKNLRNINFYKQNPTIEFTSLYRNTETYKIYAVFVLNAVRQDDGGHMYDIYKNKFSSENNFNFWYEEALDRSFIKTMVDVNKEDEFLTLVTCCNDFKNARLVVMARKTRENEGTLVDTENATLNKNVKYPKAWYKKRGLSYPF